jgi:hypothetical protein
MKASMGREIGSYFNISIPMSHMQLSGVPRAPSFLPAEKPIFESLDIEDVDNTVYRAASAAR